MAQLKKTLSVTNGSATVTLTGDFAAQIKKNFVFMVEGELVPYTVAADAVYSAVTGQTTFNLTGNYQGGTNAAAAGVIVVDVTYPHQIPLIRQGDVGTAAVFTAAMYRLQGMLGVLTPENLDANVALAEQINADAAAAVAAAAESQAAVGSLQSALIGVATNMIKTQTVLIQKNAFT